MSKIELNRSQKIELFVKNLWSWFNGNLRLINEFATKFGLKMQYDQVEGWMIEDLMPSIMLPKQTAPVAFNWLLKINNEDKTFRVEELIRAFKCFEAIVNNQLEAEKLFIELGVHGRVVVAKIAASQNAQIGDKVLEFISPLIKQNIDPTEIPFNKGEALTTEILASHLGSILDNKQEQDSNNVILGATEIND